VSGEMCGDGIDQVRLRGELREDVLLEVVEVAIVHRLPFLQEEDVVHQRIEFLSNFPRHDDHTPAHNQCLVLEDCHDCHHAAGDQET
jgi:hypothetical protein